MLWIVSAGFWKNEVGIYLRLLIFVRRWRMNVNIFSRLNNILSLKFGFYRFFSHLFQKVVKKNSIYSSDVSVSALIGKDIVIGKGTQVDSTTSINSYVYIGRNCSVTRTKIGRYASIGNNVSIGPGEHDLGRISTSSLFYDDPYNELTKGDCSIECDAWIGVDAIIMRGVRVGVGAAVAANAVVTKDVPDFAVVAGIPAKVLKYRFDEDKRNEILASQWWLKEKSEAKKIIEDLSREIK